MLFNFDNCKYLPLHTDQTENLQVTSYIMFINMNFWFDYTISYIRLVKMGEAN